MTTLLQNSSVSTEEPFTAPHAPAALWQDLVHGQARVHSHAFDDEYMAVRILASCERAAMGASSQTILCETFAARAQKVVSIQRGIAPSTVSAALRQALTYLGLECAPSRIPLLLVIAAEAGLLGATVPGAFCIKQQVGDHQYTTLLLHDPRAWLLARLPSSEACVARLRLHGASLDEIAHLRGRSERTVANQLASVYRKLGVYGRGELLALLIAEYLHGNVPPPPPVPATTPARPSGVYRPWTAHAHDLADLERAAAG